MKRLKIFGIGSSTSRITWEYFNKYRLKFHFDYKTFRRFLTYGIEDPSPPDPTPDSSDRKKNRT